ncbi:MAG: PKD domain-containing protein [Bacteroidetes bacterium]|nr:PKD domain-containing protein [Bacteroidota bacterium]
MCQSGGCFSNVIVADVLPILSPAVSINLSPSTPVCDGDLITVFSNSVHGGSNPSFQWFVNNQPFGSGQDSLTAVFNDGDVISLVFTSSYQCLTNPTDTSNILTTVVLPNLTPLIAITVNPQGPVCPGDLLNFSASTTHAGTAPVYQWLLNGAAVGGNNPFLNSFGFADGDIIEVILTSSETCVTSPNATSNSIPVQISPNITPDVNIAVAPLGPICVGDLLSFTATFTGGGLTPSFNWRVNGVTTGLTGNTFSSTTLQNGDNVDVVMTSSAFCALPVRDTSNQIPAIVNPLLTPTVFISANPSGQFCDGAEITYSASTTNGGLFPSFQWLLNGNGVGVNSDTLVSSLFLNSDTLQIQLTSSETCLALNPVSSNLIIIDRLPPLDPFIIAPDEICEGKEVTLEVQAIGGTGGPYYFNWDNGLGQGTSYTFILDQTTTYTVTVSDSCSTPRDASKTITVNLLPEPAFVIEPPQATILNPYFDFIDASVNTTTWQWDFGDGQSTTLQNPSHTYLEPGTYAIQLIATSEKGVWTVLVQNSLLKMW